MTYVIVWTLKSRPLRLNKRLWPISNFYWDNSWPIRTRMLMMVTTPKITLMVILGVVTVTIMKKRRFIRIHLQNMTNCLRAGHLQSVKMLSRAFKLESIPFLKGMG